ncbi:hypothetical protein RJ639_016674 [Escallonia herrerae]|uniref:EF-hand domain-containing protein n=1 Tax=Escallonia herrerae TaxID=1293975 RepID=A0AA88VC82_9ASTE|nr:hypothetical protein RJ639_016674 [Escallonia herrerae]
MEAVAVAFRVVVLVVDVMAVAVRRGCGGDVDILVCGAAVVAFKVVLMVVVYAMADGRSSAAGLWSAGDSSNQAQNYGKVGKTEIEKLKDRIAYLFRLENTMLHGLSGTDKLLYSSNLSPEAVFEYFASLKSPTGEIFLTPADLMRAVVPVFPPSEANRVREGYLKGESVPSELCCAPSKFFMLFDTNNDGLISFAEYIFFVTLLSIPESSFSVAFKMFDHDNNGEIDKNEFKKVMALMRAQNRQGARQRDGLRVGLKVSGSVENGGLLEYFFGKDGKACLEHGKDGKACLEHGKFVQFLRDLHNENLDLQPCGDCCVVDLNLLW